MHKFAPTNTLFGFVHLLACLFFLFKTHIISGCFEMNYTDYFDIKSRDCLASASISVIGSKGTPKNGRLKVTSISALKTLSNLQLSFYTGLPWIQGHCYILNVTVFFFLAFQDRVSLCCPGCLGTHSVDQVGLELRNLPDSASQVLGL